MLVIKRIYFAIIFFISKFTWGFTSKSVPSGSQRVKSSKVITDFMRNLPEEQENAGAAKYSASGNASLMDF